METQKICEAWYKACEIFADKFGSPLPQEMLTIGSLETGWGVQLNATREEQDGIKVYAMTIWFNGWPAGIIDAGGGVFAAGSLANEETFFEWLEQQ